MANDLGLEGKHLVVAGAGGLGRALAEAAVACGMRVSAIDRQPEALQQLPASPAIRSYMADLTVIGEQPGLVQTMAAELGPIDAFVSTAAVIRRQHDLGEVTEADWNFQVEINQKSVYFLTRTIAEQMKEQGGGAIVLVSSAAGVTGGVQGTTVYGATKAAVLAIAHGFARIYAPSGVRINAAVPGTIDTPLLWAGQTEASAAAAPKFAGLGRVATPLEVARPILFLLSDWASFVTGTALDIDGGWLYR